MIIVESVAKQDDVSVVNENPSSPLLPFSAARIFSLFVIVCAPFLGGRWQGARTGCTGYHC